MTSPLADISAPRRGRPPARNEILRGDQLGGLDPADLAARFGTPLYVYDLDVIERQVGVLRAALPSIVEIAYAVKANPALAIVAHLGSLGLGADVASGGSSARGGSFEPAAGAASADSGAVPEAGCAALAMAAAGASEDSGAAVTLAAMGAPTAASPSARASRNAAWNA